MKITIDKQRVTMAEAKEVKEDARAFNYKGVEQDILSAFYRKLKEDGITVNFPDRILEMTAEAYRAGGENHYMIEATLAGWRRFTTVYFFVSQSLEINLRAWNDIDHTWVDLFGIENYAPEK